MATASTPTGPGTQMNPTVNTNAVTLPNWANQLNEQVGGAASGALTQLQATPWYSGPLTAGTSPQQQQLTQQAMNAGTAWHPYYQHGMSAAQQAQGTPINVNYDPAEMPRHLNPYLPGVLDEIQRRGNTTFEQQLRDMNPAFSGSGAFGSQRWLDANTDLASANQREIGGNIALAGNQAYQQAAKDYYDWGSLEERAAADSARIGTDVASTMFNAGNQAQANTWNAIKNPYEMLDKQREIEQQGLTANYADYMARLKAPTEQLGALSQIAQRAINPYTPSATATASTTPPADGQLAQFLKILSGVMG